MWYWVGCSGNMGRVVWELESYKHVCTSIWERAHGRLENDNHPSNGHLQILQLRSPNNWPIPLHASVQSLGIVAIWVAFLSKGFAEVPPLPLLISHLTQQSAVMWKSWLKVSLCTEKEQPHPLVAGTPHTFVWSKISLNDHSNLHIISGSDSRNMKCCCCMTLGNQGVVPIRENILN